MKHKTWFRLVVKAIGIIGLRVPDTLEALISFVQVWRSSVTPGPGYPIPPSLWSAPGMGYLYLSRLVPNILQAGIGLYLLLGGKWLVNLCIPSNRPYCPDCGYDVSRSRGLVCPECGARLDSVSRPATEGSTSGGMMP